MHFLHKLEPLLWKQCAKSGAGMQLENISLQELYDLRNQIAAEVVRQESAVKAEALKKVQALMETHRLTVDDLAKKSGLKTERQPVAVKYQHPNDAA